MLSVKKITKASPFTKKKKKKKKKKKIPEHFCCGNALPLLITLKKTNSDNIYS